MVIRFRRDVLDHQPGYVPILGGTNDLGWNASPSEIMGNLATMYEQTLAMGACSDSCDGYLRFEWKMLQPAEKDRSGSLSILPAEAKLNRLIQDYADSKGLACVDLFTVTAEPESGQLAAIYSNDGFI